MIDKIVSRDFYLRDPRIVAQELLGKVLVRKINDNIVGCIIVETEAYHGPWDPASRASKHKKGRIVERLKGPVGITLIYGIHRNWMLNIIAHKEGEWGAVLIRACHPLNWQQRKDCPGSGPGKLTRFLHIDKKLDGTPVYEKGNPLLVIDTGYNPVEIGYGWRIGVKEDLEEPHRYCIPEDPCVSIKCPFKKPLENNNINATSYAP